jgi:hypothetical protein
MAVVQLRLHSAAWEPFFGEGTQGVLQSKVSQMRPISDGSGRLRQRKSEPEEMLAQKCGAIIQPSTKPD